MADKRRFGLRCKLFAHEWYLESIISEDNITRNSAMDGVITKYNIS